MKKSLFIFLLLIFGFNVFSKGFDINISNFKQNIKEYLGEQLIIPQDNHNKLELVKYSLEMNDDFDTSIDVDKAIPVLREDSLLDLLIYEANLKLIKGENNNSLKNTLNHLESILWNYNDLLLKAQRLIELASYYFIAEDDNKALNILINLEKRSNRPDPNRELKLNDLNKYIKENEIEKVFPKLKEVGESLEYPILTYQSYSSIAVALYVAGDIKKSFDLIDQIPIPEFQDNTLYSIASYCMRDDRLKDAFSVGAKIGDEEMKYGLLKNIVFNYAKKTTPDMGFIQNIFRGIKKIFGKAKIYNMDFEDNALKDLSKKYVFMNNNLRDDILSDISILYALKGNKEKSLIIKDSFFKGENSNSIINRAIVEYFSGIKNDNKIYELFEDVGNIKNLEEYYIVAEIADYYYITEQDSKIKECIEKLDNYINEIDLDFQKGNLIFQTILKYRWMLEYSK